MRTMDQVRELTDVVEHLQGTGDLEAAQKIQRVVNDLRQEARRAAADLLTTGEAARLLGVGINTVKRWAIAGQLQAFRRGSRVLVSRASVERLLGTPAVAEEQAFDRALEEAFAPFGPDLAAGELPTSAMWERPESGVSSRAASLARAR